MNTTRTPEQIEADINDVRERMDSTLDTLEQRLDARRLLRQGLDQLRNSEAVKYAITAAADAGRAAREHPVPVAVAGASLLGLLVWGVRSRHSFAERRAIGRASEAVGTARARLMSARKVLDESTRDASGRTRHAAGRAWHGLEHAGSEARSLVRQHPRAASAAGLAVLAIAAAAAISGIQDRFGQ